MPQQDRNKDSTSDSSDQHWRLMKLLDRQRFACSVLFELTREFGDFFGESDFPFYIKDHKLFFPTAAQAGTYYRRAWRFLTENHLPLIDADSAPRVSRAGLYRMVCCQCVAHHVHSSGFDSVHQRLLAQNGIY